MKYRLFEQAADEARAGIDELDAEIDRLNARRELLQVLEALVDQTLTVFPESAEGIAPQEQSSAPPETAAAEEPSRAGLPLQGKSELFQRELSSPEAPPRYTGVVPPTEQASLQASSPELAFDRATAEGPTSDFTAETGTKAISAERSWEAYSPSTGRCEPAEADDSQPYDSHGWLATTPIAEELAPAAERMEHDLRTQPSQNASPDEVTDDSADPEQASLSEYLWRQERFSLRKRGWPGAPPVDPAEIRKKLL